MYIAMRNLFTFLLVLTGISISAQSFVLNLPRASQGATVSQTVGITELKIEYHAPSLRERTLLGNLIPYNVDGTIPWRGGADENTVFSANSQISIGGNPLDAGSYGLHFWVTQEEIVAIFSTNSESWGSFNYTMEEDALRMPIAKGEAPYVLERMHYQFENITPVSCDLVMHWGDQYWLLPIEVEVNDVVIADIRQELQTQAGWLWVGWFEAANYCLQNNTNLDEANTWINNSIQINTNPTNLRTSGRIMLAQGKPKQEVAADLEAKLSSLVVTWKEYNAVARFSLNNLDDPDMAVRLATKSAEMSPNYSNTSTVAAAMRSQGKEEATKKLQREALTLSSNAQANNYAYQLINKGNLDEALEVFQFNAERFPEDPNVHDSLGEAYHISGDDKNAEASLRKSLSLNPPANVRANSLRILHEMGVNTGKI